MVSRRQFTFGSTLSAVLQAQSSARPLVALSVAVTDASGRYIRGLTAADFSIEEDRIRQTLHAFAQPGSAPLHVDRDGATQPLADAEAIAAMTRSLDDMLSSSDRENSYVLAYHPDPSNLNKGYRAFRVTVSQPNLRIRTKPGYRPVRN